MNFAGVEAQVLVDRFQLVVKRGDLLFDRDLFRIEVTEQDIFKIDLIFLQNTLIGGLFRQIIAWEKKTDQVVEPGCGIMPGGSRLPLGMMRFF